jgi:hypothetical protein
MVRFATFVSHYHGFPYIVGLTITQRHYAKELGVKFEKVKADGAVTWVSNGDFWELYDKKLLKMNTALLGTDAAKKAAANQYGFRLLRSHHYSRLQNA